MNALLSLSALGVIALLSEIFNFKKLLYPIVLVGLAIAIFLNILEWGQFKTWYGMMTVDKFSLGFSGLFLVIGFLWFLLLADNSYDEAHKSDHYSIILFSIAGAVVMVSFNNLSMLFLGIEILSISMYIMAASKKNDLGSNEAGFKYFLMGAFATGILLFGIALLYGATGTFDTVKIGTYVNENYKNLPSIFYAGLILLMIGMCFKISAVPFHWWAPDVYTGAPTIITAFMSTIVKTAAFAAFLRLFVSCFSEVELFWNQSLMIVSGATILLGNISALLQNDFKRILAFSSVAHAGYMLLAVLAMNGQSGSSLLFYTSAYSISSLSAFAVLLAISKFKGVTTVQAFKGLAKQNPFITIVVIIAMLSLAGIPPTAGFFAKYYIFTAAIANNYLGLALVAIVGSIISIFYYFRIIIVMFEGDANEEVSLGFFSKVLLVTCSILIILLGLLPDLLIKLI